MKSKKYLFLITVLGIAMITAWHVSFVKRSGVYSEGNAGWWIALPSKPLWASSSLPLISDFHKAFGSQIPPCGTISVRTEWSIMATNIVLESLFLLLLVNIIFYFRWNEGHVLSRYYHRVGIYIILAVVIVVTVLYLIYPFGDVKWLLLGIGLFPAIRLAYDNFAQKIEQKDRPNR